MAGECLPTEVSRGMVKFGPVEVEVVQLDDGRRLVTAESMAKLLDWMGREDGPAGLEETEDGG